MMMKQSVPLLVLVLCVVGTLAAPKVSLPDWSELATRAQRGE